MKLVFVRHAEPDYAIDSLTKKGHVEAELLSRRLCQLDVKNFYVSPLGRAKDTAAYTLNKLGRTAEELPWLAEFRGKYFDENEGRERISWDFRPRFWTPRKELHDPVEWVNDPIFAGSNVSQVWQETCDGIDEVLARHGYTRDGDGIYLCDNNQKDTLVFFCHLGIIMATIAHLMHVSPVHLWQWFSTQPSSVTTLVTEERVKGEVIFRCMQMGDISHLYAGGETYSTAGLFPEVYTGRDSTNPPEWDDEKPAME